MCYTFPVMNKIGGKEMFAVTMMRNMMMCMSMMDMDIPCCAL